ncbi:hypothetical protein [Salimicrobium halophilum]|uniref:Uncharacterized protein n=1 Tax=Salimicrobium halophilum TaxID=86666 RepID=A0A1G8QI83_9BACI|nr:hypothetical protein [Salimicrobium halophilum]SDJ04303.1 hypothetical protein SAMN04490247_0631 [Salimicrobium halophilum]
MRNILLACAVIFCFVLTGFAIAVELFWLAVLLFLAGGGIMGYGIKINKQERT